MANHAATTSVSLPFTGPRPRRRLLLWENTVLAFEALWDRKFRSFLTSLGVFIGVVIIIGVASVLNGFRQQLVDRVESFGTNTIYISRFSPIHIGRTSSDIRKRKPLSLDDAWAIRDECPAVAAVSPTMERGISQGVVKYEGQEMIGARLRGCFPSQAQVLNQELAQGRFFTEEENRRGLAVAVIGDRVATTLFPSVPATGKEILADGQRYVVIGVMEKFRNAPFGGESPEDSLLLIPYFKLHKTYPWMRDNWITVLAKSGRRAEAMEQIEEALRKRRHIPWKAPNDFELMTTDSLIAAFDAIIFAALAVMVALSSVAFLVGGVGVTNVMFASVKERTREIGIRRAIGARKRDVIWQFLTEAMALTGVGGVLGVVAGEIMIQTVAVVFPGVPCATPIWARVFGFFGSVGVGLFFGLLPAITAARLDPITALRYE